MHEELKAIGGHITMGHTGKNIMADVFLNGVRIGSYWPQDSTWGSFSATVWFQKDANPGTLSLSCERAAVDWIIGQYFLQRSKT